MGSEIPVVPVPFENMGLREQNLFLREQILNIDKSRKVKGFRLPFGVTFGGRGKVKRGKVLVCYPRRNKAVNFFWRPIVDGTVKVGDVSHNAHPGFMFLYKRWPMLIIPEWQVNPINPENFTDETTAQQIMIRGVEAKEGLSGKKLGGKNLLWIGIGGIIIAYLVFGGGIG